MKKELNYIAIISLALILSVSVLGCGGKTTKNETSGAGYTVSVNPANVVAGGTTVIKVELRNNYVNDMTNVNSWLLNVPSTAGYSGASENPMSGTTISPGQAIPAIWTIGVADTTLKETLTPTAKICYNYNSSYQFQSAFRQAKALGEVTLSSSVSSGPIAISAMGADSIFVKNDTPNNRSVTLEITNVGGGYINNISQVALMVPDASGIVRGGYAIYTDCSAYAAAKGTASITTTCAKFSNKNVVGQGITVRLQLETKDDGNMAATNPVIDKIGGYVAFNYCLEIPVGTITVCPAGQVC